MSDPDQRDFQEMFNSIEADDRANASYLRDAHLSLPDIDRKKTTRDLAIQN